MSAAIAIACAIDDATIARRSARRSPRFAASRRGLRVRRSA
jgi:hypothetical protein